MLTRERMDHLPDNECIVEVLLNVVSECQCNDCGKCVFGYEGISQLRMILHDISQKKGRNGDILLLEEISQLMETQSICETGTDLARVLAGAIRKHKDDLDAHITKKVCPAGVCKKFMTIHIVPDKCIGCGDCLDGCDEDAIMGKKRFIHVIDQDECTQCGSCLKLCDEGAIVTAGAIKPRTPRKPIPCKAR